MPDIPDGYVEVVHSQTEKVGLANWSFVNIMVSMKATCPWNQAEAADAYIFSVVNAFTRERAEIMANELNMWAGVEGSMQEMTEDQKMGLTPVGVTFYGPSFLTFSRTETVGLPDKASINLLASSQMGVAPEVAFMGFRSLAEYVAKQMKKKREVVLANPRPWITSAS
jgi:hypothetical protein